MNTHAPRTLAHLALSCVLGVVVASCSGGSSSGDGSNGPGPVVIGGVDHTPFLTGAHVSLGCDSCHHGNYTATSSSCESCHAANRPSGHFPGTCESCHTTAAGRAAPSITPE